LLDFAIGGVDGSLEFMLIALKLEDDAFVVLLPVIDHVFLLVVVNSCHLELQS
jgi:hypothetical protein